MDDREPHAIVSDTVTVMVDTKVPNGNRSLLAPLEPRMLILSI